MSTPIKPPDDPSAPDAPDATQGAEAGPVDRAEGRFGDLVDEAKGDLGSVAPEAASPLGGLERDLIAGRTSVDEAVAHIVRRALANTSGLSEDHRAVLESQLRDALDGDPTLAALREDLQRVVSKG